MTLLVFHFTDVIDISKNDVQKVNDISTRAKGNTTSKLVSKVNAEETPFLSGDDMQLREQI